MERPTPVTPPPDMRIRGVQGPDARRREEREEEDARDILESVFIEDQTSGAPGVSPVWVEIPPDDISLRAAQTLYPPPAPRKRFDENTLLTALGVVTTLAAGVVLFFLARGPSRPIPTAAPPPAAAAPASPQVPPPPATAPAPSDTAPLTSPVERNPTATTLTVPPVVRDSPVAKAAAIETARLNAQAAARPSAPVAARPSAAAPASAPASASAPAPSSVRPAPEATIGSRLQPPVPELAVATTSVGSPAPAPAAPVPATPPAAAPPIVAAPPVAAPPAAANASAATAVSAAAAPPPAPRPAAPAGAPSPSPAALAPAADEQGIRAVVERYRAAYSALDVNAVRAIWPRVNARALGRAFDQLSTQQVDFAGCEISVTGERASAGCSGNMEFVPKVGNKTPRLEARTWSFELRKSGAQWTIEAVESR